MFATTAGLSLSLFRELVIMSLVRTAFTRHSLQLSCFGLESQEDAKGEKKDALIKHVFKSKGVNVYL
jgi:hypothetical protein